MGVVDGGIIHCIDPRTGEPSGEVPCTPVAEVHDAVSAAREAQVAWAEKTLAARKAAVAQLHAAFLERADDVATALATDCGRPAGEAWTAEIVDRKSTRLNSSHSQQSRMPSSA